MTFQLGSKTKPPKSAIAINRPDGTPYMHVWHDRKNNRVCVMFSRMPGVSTQWAAQTLPDLITAFESLQAEIARENGHIPDAGKMMPTLTDAERAAVENMIHLIEKQHDECGKEAYYLRGLLARLA